MRLENQIDKKHCLICFKPIPLFSIRSLIGDNYCCDECLKELNVKIKRIHLRGIQGYGFYLYEGKVKSLIYQFKGCYDILLAPVFLNSYKIIVKLFCLNKIIVPIPSSKTADEKRTFNHVKQILKSLDINYVDCLVKNTDEKQSSKRFKQRKEVGKYFDLNDKKETLRDKNVILFDDVLTTGSTIIACANLIKGCGAKKVSFLVLSYTSR